MRGWGQPAHAQKLTCGWQASLSCVALQADASLNNISSTCDKDSKQVMHACCTCEALHLESALAGLQSRYWLPQMQLSSCAI